MKTSCPSLVALPGLDGTGRLFARLRAQLPTWVDLVIIDYPAERALGYAELETRVRKQLPLDRSFVLLGESFSGPLAVTLAAQAPPGLCGVITVASFLRDPLPPMLRRLVAPVGPHLFRLRPPELVLRTLLTGLNAPSSLVEELRSTIDLVAPSVLLHRVKELAGLHHDELLGRVHVPVACLHAQRDRLVPACERARWQTLKPDITSFEFDTPHLLLQTAPEPAATAIASFLAQRTTGFPS